VLADGGAESATASTTLQSTIENIGIKNTTISRQVMPKYSDAGGRLVVARLTSLYLDMRHLQI
jgi:hypothetical protein